MNKSGNKVQFQLWKSSSIVGGLGIQGGKAAAPNSNNLFFGANVFFINPLFLFSNPFRILSMQFLNIFFLVLVIVELFLLILSAANFFALFPINLHEFEDLPKEVRKDVRDNVQVM